MRQKPRLTPTAELHYLDGAWYVYVAMDDGNNKNHRMYVLKGTDSKDPTKPFKVRSACCAISTRSLY